MEEEEEKVGIVPEEMQTFININDFSYSMEYVDKVLERVDLADIVKSVEEESDPISTDHFFKIEEEATLSSDPEYIYHKLLFDAMNEVLLSRVNHPDFRSRIREGGAEGLAETRKEVKDKVGALVKFGLSNLDANQELVKICNLELPDETRVFSDFDKFFKDTRNELVEGVLGYILEDTVRVLTECESSSTDRK